MNDPGLDNSIESSANHISRTLKSQIPGDAQTRKRHISTNHSAGARELFREELLVDEEEEEVGFFQPKRWWFTSTAFPLIAGTFGPLASLLSVCALVQPWRVNIPDGGTEAEGTPITDPPWLLALNSVSLALAIVANFFLLFNFAHRVRYAIAQPVTIILWYLSSVLLIIPLCLTRKLILYPTLTHAFSQSYYYAIISSSLYSLVATLLLANLLGAWVFHAYPASFNSLTIPQRTLMLQTISYVFYLALGAGIFARIENWAYVDALYWIDYTLLTIGLGSDFSPQTVTGRAILIPYAACGITMLGLVIGSVRGLVLERGKLKVERRALDKERGKWRDDRDAWIRKYDLETGSHQDESSSSLSREWGKNEFRAMRIIQDRTNRIEKWWSLGLSFFAFLLVWLGGAMVFTFSEKPQSWTYFDSLYFAYTSLLTIGYGDIYPRSNSGKPFFVIWSLIAIPTVTILISNMGDTVVGWLREGTLWLGQMTILPERANDGSLTIKGPKTVQEAARKEEEREEQEEEQEERNGDGEEGSSAKGLGRDVEILGEAVEKAEEDQGRQSGLPARIAKEIAGLAGNVGMKPPVKYTWEQWVGWLVLLDEKDGSRKDKEKETEKTKETAEHDEWTWSWLGDDGPLFSTVSETEWILGRLCKRLEKVLQHEIEGASTSKG